MSRATRGSIDSLMPHKRALFCPIHSMLALPCSLMHQYYLPYPPWFPPTIAGAGLVHGLDLADADECGGSTGVLEMFPQPNTEKGIRNMNVQVGRNYWTWHNEDPGRETGSGTLVDKEAIRGIVAGALGTIIGQRKACAV